MAISEKGSIDEEISELLLKKEDLASELSVVKSSLQYFFRSSCMRSFKQNA